MKLAEFFVSLVVDSDQKSLDDFNNGVSELDKGLKQLKLLATAFALTKFTQATVDASVAMQNFRNQTGLFVGDLQKWQVAGELSDISLSAEAVAGSIASLQSNLTQIRLGGGNVSPFQLLGVDVAGKDAFQVLKDLKESIKGLDNSTATNLIQQTGLSPQFINVLRLTNEEFAKLTENRSFLSAEKQKLVVEMGTAFADLKLRLVALKDQIVAGIAPALRDFINLMGGIVQRITSIIQMIPNVTGGMESLSLVSRRLMILLTPIRAVFLAIFLLIDDFVTFLQGGDSGIGRLLDMFDSIGSKIKESITEPLNEAMALFREFTGMKSGETAVISKIAGGAQGNMALDSLMGRARGVVNSITNSFSNTFSINSTADPKTLAENISSNQQRDLNYALSEINNGVAN